MLKNIDTLLDFVWRLDGVKQGEINHPEVDAFNHTLQVFRYALRESDDIELILAALLHDIGKAERTDGHEQIAVELLKPFCTDKTLWLIEQHIRVRLYLDGTMKKLGKCKELANHKWLPELIQLRRWDNAGRRPNVKIVFDRQDIIDRLSKYGFTTSPLSWFSEEVCKLFRINQYVLFKR